MAKPSMERLNRIWRSNVNEVLDRLEDPEKMVRQVTRDMEEAVAQAVGSLARAVAGQRRLERRCMQLEKDIQAWQQRAQRAVAVSDEDYARQALRRRNGLEDALGETRAALADSRQRTVELRAQLEDMRVRLEQARAREQNLTSRIRAERGERAERQGGGQDPFRRFQQLQLRVSGHQNELERYEEQVDAAVAEAELYREMSAGLRDESGLEASEQEKRIEEELAALRDRTRPQD